MASKTGAKAIIWPEIITQSTLKSWWNTNMKACIFGSFNSTQHRLITVMALSCATPWKYLILLHAVYHYCRTFKHTHTHTQSHAHTAAISTDGYYVFSGVFYLSLPFFITVFILIMWCLLKARFKYLDLFKAQADSGSNKVLCFGTTAWRLFLRRTCFFWLIPL